MDWRLRLPSALYRLASVKAGGQKELTDYVIKCLENYVDAHGQGAAGGRASAAGFSPEERSARARHARHAQMAAQGLEPRTRAEDAPERPREASTPPPARVVTTADAVTDRFPFPSPYRRRLS